MATYGYLFCLTCKEQIFMGKWLADSEERGTGFWHGTLCPPVATDASALGRKVLRFIARHMDHEILVGSDEGGRAEDMLGSGVFRDVNDEYDEFAQQTGG